MALKALTARHCGSCHILTPVISCTKVSSVTPALTEATSTRMKCATRAPQAMLLMQKAKTYLQEAEVRGTVPHSRVRCRTWKNVSQLRRLRQGFTPHRQSSGQCGNLRGCEAMDSSGTQGMRVNPQADEAEARNRLLRWRDLKEAVEKLDNQEKRVRAEVRHPLCKICCEPNCAPAGCAQCSASQWPVCGIS